MEIITGRKYNDGQQQVYDVTKIDGDTLSYRDPKTGMTGSVLVINGIVYAQSLFAGDYYPTAYTIEAEEGLK